MGLSEVVENDAEFFVRESRIVEFAELDLQVSQLAVLIPDLHAVVP